MYCELLCKACTHKCASEPTEAVPKDLQCIHCRGAGCDRCHDGYFELTRCPKKEVGSALYSELAMVNHAMNDKLLPDHGGINDQEARFVNLWRAFRADISYIERITAKNGR